MCNVKPCDLISLKKMNKRRINEIILVLLYNVVNKKVKSIQSMLEISSIHKFREFTFN